MKPHPRLGYWRLLWEVAKVPIYFCRWLLGKKPKSLPYPTDAEIKARRLEAKKRNKNNKNN